MNTRRTYSLFNIITLLALLTSLLGSALTFTPASAAGSISVNSNADTVANNGFCTLREAITSANTGTASGAMSGECAAGAGTDTITFAADYTITLAGSQLPAVTTAIIIKGNGEAKTIIQADTTPNTATYRVIEVSSAGNLTLDSLTIQNGFLSTTGGGGILNDGLLTVTNSSISANSATAGGGIMNNSGPLTVTNSTISGNSATWGGGIYSQATLTVTNSALSNNSATYGGGILSLSVGTLKVTNSTLSNNTATTDGGGINTGGSLIMINSTISLNAAYVNGGGISNYGTAYIYNTTIAFNGADQDANASGSGGGVFNDAASTFNLINTLVVNNYVSISNLDDCSGTLGSFGGNLFWVVNGGCTINNLSGGWGYLNSIYFIGPLQNNGGPTSTHALLPGSNAIDGGNPTFGCIDDSGFVQLSADQRGAARVSGNWCDIGAYELHPTLNVKSINANDGWVLESTETSNAGGALNSSSTVFNLGDGAADKQYRAILHFDLTPLPAGAVVTKVTLKIRKQGQVGANPFNTLGKILVDIRKGAFSNNNALQLTDFQVAAHKNAAGGIQNSPVNNWYSVKFPASAFAFLNKTGVTQFRLRFQIDDNDNGTADYLKFYSGNYATASVRPTLVIEYYIP